MVCGEGSKMNFFIEGRRGAPKMLLRSLPCLQCNFVADDPYSLGEHITNKHGIIFLWAASNFENQFENRFKKIERLWKNIAKFEKAEQKNDSKNSLLSDARKAARMAAYESLMEKELEDP